MGLKKKPTKTRYNSLKAGKTIEILGCHQEDMGQMRGNQVKPSKIVSNSFQIAPTQQNPSTIETFGWHKKKIGKTRGKLGKPKKT